MTTRSLRTLCGIALLAASLVASGASDEWVEVTVRGTLKAGLMAIGGETTGVTISADGVVWELELHGRDLEAARGFNGSNVIVTGRLVRRKGVEVGDRYVVKVRSINAGTARAPTKSR